MSRNRISTLNIANTPDARTYVMDRLVFEGDYDAQNAVAENVARELVSVLREIEPAEIDSDEALSLALERAGFDAADFGLQRFV
jgi:microcystin degradation protein MlrC